MSEEQKPQRLRVAEARVDLTLALMQIAEKHGLSQSEMVYLVAEKLHDWARFAMREKQSRKKRS